MLKSRLDNVISETKRCAVLHSCAVWRGSLLMAYSHMVFFLSYQPNGNLLKQKANLGRQWLIDLRDKWQIHQSGKRSRPRLSFTPCQKVCRLSKHLNQQLITSLVKWLRFTNLCLRVTSRDSRGNLINQPLIDSNYSNYEKSSLRSFTLIYVCALPISINVL